MPARFRHHLQCHKPQDQREAEIVETRQVPLLSGDTCVCLGLMCITIPDELNEVEADQTTPLTKEQLLQSYRDVFNYPIGSVPGEIHFDLDPNVTPVQCAPRNVPVALRARVKKELDRHIREGNITPVTEPTA